nr:MAG TPA: hypothetical protein [Caudoviricetes sp.]DAP86530.1 MAG TPA: hypothetical protein [Caudoviricetes sp.]
MSLIVLLCAKVLKTVDINRVDSKKMYLCLQNKDVYDDE